MMTITTQDGATFSGETPEAVVKQMQADDWSAPPKKREYMIEVADRIAEMTGKTVRADAGATAFLHDLTVAGFVVGLSK